MMPTIRLGRHVIAPAVMLAPMAGVTDWPFRTICRSFGAGYCVGEMTASRADLRETAKSRTRWVEAAEDGLKAVQILGADPAVMADAALAAQEDGADVVDINMGCPAKKVLSTACGSALMRDPALIDRILAAVTAAVSIPVTLKIRTGWSPEMKNAVEVARIAEDRGIAMLVVHGRTRADGFRGSAEYDTIAAVKAAVGIPVVANGDIDSGEKARLVLEKTGADGVMIGRAALGRPWLFAEAAAALEGIPAEPLNRKQIRETVLRHARLHFDYYEGRRGWTAMRKHFAYYLRALPDPEELLPQILRAPNGWAALALVERFFDVLPP